jgi:hypothetical protein
MGVLEKHKNIITPIRNGISLSSNSVSAKAPVGKKIIRTIKPVVIANATALIHFAKKLSLRILLDKISPRYRHINMPKLAMKSMNQGNNSS